MNYLISMLTVVLFATTPAPVDDCKVLLESIAKTYEGDCKKGLANGTGKATGIDTYEGEFKKGLPHGTGTYTWENGNVFKGEWSKGVKDGEGELTLADGTVETGFWADDEYIGKEKNPYKIINKSVSMNRATFKRLEREPNQLEFKFTRLGKPVKVRSLQLQGSFGAIINETEFVRTVNVHEYPFQGAITFSAMAGRDVGGTTSGDYMDGNMEFSISQAGKWEITIELQAND